MGDVESALQNLRKNFFAEIGERQGHVGVGENHLVADAGQILQLFRHVGDFWRCKAGRASRRLDRLLDERERGGLLGGKNHRVAYEPAYGFGGQFQLADNYRSRETSEYPGDNAL
ncbi:MAG: hypothetical protein O7A04_07625 [Acidobacteria bacterium]|nr:hypothetical protein [Acidobacteriota bacterium]